MRRFDLLSSLKKLPDQITFIYLKHFVLTHRRRIDIYRNLQMITGSGISLNETIRLLALKFRKHMPRSSMPRILDDWLKSMAMGRTFNQAIAPWVPGWELLLLRAGGSTQVTHMLRYVSELSSNIIKLKSGLYGALRYPLFALLMLVVLLMVFAYYVIPNLVTFLPPEQWPPITKRLYTFTTFITQKGIFVLIGIILAVGLIAYSMGHLKSGLPRRILNKIPPWSIYKQFHGSIFLLSLASLLRSGISFGHSLETIRTSSSKYVSSVLIMMQAKLQAGKRAGEAIQSELFDKETLINLEVYADADKLEEGIYVLAEEQLSRQIEKLSAATKVLGNFILLVVVLFIIWNYMGLIALQSATGTAGTF
jgi:type II secretory pathway component PulF